MKQQHGVTGNNTIYELVKEGVIEKRVDQVRLQGKPFVHFYPAGEDVRG
jgi:hypothetical protein